MDPYQELGLKRDATPEDVKRAYRKERTRAHPDKGGTKEKFHAVQRSFEILDDPDRRKRYDTTGDESTPVADPREQAMSELAGMFVQIVTSVDADHTNVLSLVKQNIEQAITTNKGQITQFSTSIEKLERALKRVSRKTEGPNVFALFLQNTINANHQSIAQRKALIERAEFMLGVLAEYEYKADLFEPAHMRQQFQAMAGGFSPFGR